MKKPNEVKSRCIFCGNFVRLSKLRKHKKRCLKAYLKSNNAIELRARNIAATEEAAKRASVDNKVHPLIDMLKHGFTRQHEANYGKRL